jgi:hypothetical protein
MSSSPTYRVAENVGSKQAFVNKNFWLAQVGLPAKVRGFTRQLLLVWGFVNGLEQSPLATIYECL